MRPHPPATGGVHFEKLLRTGNPIIHSPAVLPSRWPELINASDADKRICRGGAGRVMLDQSPTSPAIFGANRLDLHDMWAFCGAEH